MNHIIIVGKVSKAAEAATTKAGKSFVGFTVEASSPFGKFPDRFSIYVYGKLGEGLTLAVGAQVMVSGRVSARAYTNKDNEPRAQLCVTADAIETLDGAAAATDSTDDVGF